MGRVRALWVLHHAFGRYPAGHRLHMIIRFLTCPFTRFLDDIPQGARVLEIGSGHGLFARLLVERTASEVIAVEPDLRKSLLPSPSPKIRKIAGYDDCVRGTFDAVVMVDVAYRLPVAEHRALFRRVFERLRSGGVFVLKELDPARRGKLAFTRLQESVNDRFLGVTAGEGFHYQTRDEIEALLTSVGFTRFRARRLDRGYPYPHIVYTAARP